MPRARPGFGTLALAGLLSALPAAASDPPRFSLDHLRQLVNLSEPQLSPDEHSVAVVVSRPNYAENREDTELVLVEVATGAVRVLTRERAEVAWPRWSPNGGRLAFLARAGSGGEAKQQIFVLPVGGGEARQLTRAPQGVRHFSWRPDGAALAFAAADEPPKKEGEAKFNDSFEVGHDDVFLAAAPAPTHVWLVGAEGGEARRITSGEWSLPVTLPPGPPSSPLSWSPDGATIALARRATPHSGDADKRRVMLVDVASGALRPLTAAETFESTPVFSPDGKWVSYWYPRDGDPGSVQEIYVAPARGGPGRSLTRAIDRNVYSARWTADGREVVVAGNTETTVGLWRQPLEGPASRLPLGDVTISGAFGYDFALGADGAVALVGLTPDRPAELYYLAPGASSPRRLTDFNPFVSTLALGRSERVTWKTDGGIADGVLVYPPGYNPGRRYPLVLEVHGGPRAASKDAFSALSQLLAAQGWLVFKPNYRGSDNLGSAFQRAIWGDAGAGPGRDVMAGVAELERRGSVDESRLAVTGWSYGGFMTAWLAGNYGVWRVAVAGAPVTDWEDMYNLNDGNVSLRHQFEGSPWTDRRQAYRDQSPITYAHRIRAPMLVMSNLSDFRVPVTQSYKLFRAIEDNGVEAKFIAYPGREHFPREPVRTMDVYRRWVDWVGAHFAE